MDYQPFLNMHVLVSNALLDTVPPMLIIILIVIAVFPTFCIFRRWLNKDHFIR